MYLSKLENVFLQIGEYICAPAWLELYEGILPEGSPLAAAQAAKCQHHRHPAELQHPPLASRSGET